MDYQAGKLYKVRSLSIDSYSAPTEVPLYVTDRWIGGTTQWPYRKQVGSIPENEIVFFVNSFWDEFVMAWFYRVIWRDLIGMVLADDVEFRAEPLLVEEVPVVALDGSGAG